MDNVLTDVARVSIDTHTSDIAQKPLTAKRRKELRAAQIVAYLADRPYGKRVKVSEIAKLPGMKSYATVQNQLAQLIQEGTIVRHPLSLKACFYTVPGQLRVTRSAVNTDLGKKEVTVEPRLTPLGGDAMPELIDIEEKAMRFLWAYPEGGVREFIKWIKSQEK